MSLIEKLDEGLKAIVTAQNKKTTMDYPEAYGRLMGLIEAVRGDFQRFPKASRVHLLYLLGRAEEIDAELRAAQKDKLP